MALLCLPGVRLALGAEGPDERRRLADELAELGTDVAEEVADSVVFWQAWTILQEHFLYVEALDPDRMVDGARSGLREELARLEAAPPVGSTTGPPPASVRRAAHGAIRGMVRGLGDRDTVFLTPEERSVVIAGFSGHFEGIGACFDLRGDRVVVSGLVDGSPAARADLRPGDEVLAVDGRPVEGRSAHDLVLRVRGPSGTEVALTVRRAAGGGPTEVMLRREEIRLPSARQLLVEPGIGLLRLAAFTESTDDEAGAALEALRRQDARALVLDLRENLGGLLRPAVAVAARLVATDPIVWQENARGERFGYERPAGREALDWPLVVLVNRRTASASEVVAMALRDAGRAPLVGERTYGKGTVQYLFELLDGSGLHVTSARWIGPAGTTLERGGLLPDVWAGPASADGDDPAAEQAVRVLRQGLSTEPSGPAPRLVVPADDCSPNSAYAA